MCGASGRALIISNTCNGERQGSEHDFRNVKVMLEKFGYRTTGNHRNYTVQVGNNKY